MYYGYCTVLDRRTGFLAQHIQWDSLAGWDHVGIIIFHPSIVFTLCSDFSMLLHDNCSPCRFSLLSMSSGTLAE